MRIISIDIGMNNFAAITNNIGKEPNLIRGKTLKAENQWYNKITQPLRQQLKQAYDIEQREKLSYNINKLAKQTIEHIFEYFWSVSEWIINYCIDNKIDTLLIGQYKMLVRKDYVTIPYGYFYSLLETKCVYHNIKFVLVNDILQEHHFLMANRQQRNFTTRNEEYISIFGNVITENVLMQM